MAYLYLSSERSRACKSPASFLGGANSVMPAFDIHPFVFLPMFPLIQTQGH